MRVRMAKEGGTGTHRQSVSATALRWVFVILVCWVPSVFLHTAGAASSEAAKREYELGLQRAKQGAVDDAIRDFKKAVELDPHLADAHYQLGLLLLHEKIIQRSRSGIPTSGVGQSQTGRGAP